MLLLLTQNMIPSAPPSYDESQLRHGQGQGPPQATVPAPQVQVVREIHYVEAPSFGHSPQVAMCSACGVQVTKTCSNNVDHFTFYEGDNKHQQVPEPGGLDDHHHPVLSPGLSLRMYSLLYGQLP